MALLKDFFYQPGGENLKGISHKNVLLKQSIIAHMAVQGWCTLAELTKALHISVPTMTKLVGELVEEGVVVDNGKVETAGGRRPNIFGLANTAIYFTGVDIGRDYICMLVTDLKNNTITTKMHTPFTLSDDEACLNSICQIINKLRQF